MRITIWITNVSGHQTFLAWGFQFNEQTVPEQFVGGLGAAFSLNRVDHNVQRTCQTYHTEITNIYNIYTCIYMYVYIVPQFSYDPVSNHRLILCQSGKGSICSFRVYFCHTPIIHLFSMVITVVLFHFVLLPIWNGKSTICRSCCEQVSPWVFHMIVYPRDYNNHKSQDKFWL